MIDTTTSHSATAIVQTDGLGVILNYVSGMNKELKTYLDSPTPKQRWKQRKPMYQKKTKKEVKLHPLLAGLTGKRKY